ncbi:hypothetical protein DFH08DRAFT_988085 [Mycena albidolilacea]|uniref:F-box domain-containing protein n=1 Tax=Mycena albidolilacea TaxID=1033008 RepID=A0AAD7EWX4_9AGAR|nr:hypothetical protein DFH08DRAFT_988085 [Mycena albidolilacea]
MESPFSNRFNTNYIPSDEEIQFIRRDLVLHAQELARTDEHICKLTTQRDQIQAYVDSHKALISHPRRIPPDIVREIFVACLPSDRNTVMSAQEAPLLLCRICKFLHLPPEIVAQFAGIRPRELESFKFTGSISSLHALDMIQVPTLRVVSLHARKSGYLDDAVLKMPLVWNQLTHITLQFSVRTTGSEDDFPPGPLSLPFLETLIMTEGSFQAQSLGHLLEHLSIPHLRRFHAESSRIPGSFSLGAITPASPLIEDLGNPHLPSLTAESVAETLHSLPSLTRLCVTDYDVWAANPTTSNASHLLHLLTLRRDIDAVVCPALRELVINHCGDLEQGTLDAFIQGRKEFSLDFRRLEFRNPSADIRGLHGRAYFPACE